MINIINDDLYHHINEYDLILVGTGIHCTMANGFQRKVMLNYPYVQEMNMKTKYADKNKLGTILECKDANQPTFILLFINEGNFRPDLKKESLSYDSLEKCIKIINILYKGKNIASTILGLSRFEGNGDRDKIMKILSGNCDNINLSLFDYKQLSRSEELKNIRDAELDLKKRDINAYYKAVKQRKEEADKRFKNNGHARY